MPALTPLAGLAAPPEGASPWAGLIPMLFLVAIFYFLLVAPVRRRQKKQQQMIEALKTGDRVVTNGGIFGTVVGIAEDRVTLRIADQVKVEVTKSSISGLDQDED